MAGGGEDPVSRARHRRMCRLLREHPLECSELPLLPVAEVDEDGRLLEVEPGLTVAGFKGAATYFPPEILDVWVDGFRKAGVPEG